MQPGKKTMSPVATVAAAVVGVAVIVGGAALALTEEPAPRVAQDAGTAAQVVEMPPARRCAAFAERNSNNGIADREQHASGFNIERPSAAIGRWSSVEPRTLVIRGIASCDRASILSALPQSMPSAARSSCTSFGFRLLRCEPSSGPPRTIDLTEACPCSDPSDPASCRCDF